MDSCFILEHHGLQERDKDQRNHVILVNSINIMGKLLKEITSVLFTILMCSTSGCYYSLSDKIATEKSTEEGLVFSQTDPAHNHGPLSDGNIFKAVWNVPRDQCQSVFGVDLELEKYGIEANPVGKSWHGSVMTIFHNVALGLYPFLEADGKGGIVSKNAGLPQVSIMTMLTRVL